MIERVVGCFGRGGHGQLQLRKKPFRTRRYLHHAFWSHGAGNIDLPTWWKILLQQHDSQNSDPSQEQVSLTDGVAAGLQKIVLQLLYPVQTHVLIHRLNRATKLHRQQAQLALKGSREFTSIAKDLLNGKTGTRSYVQNGERGQPGNTLSSENTEKYKERVEALIGNVDRPQKLDELWKLQQTSFEAGTPLDTAILRDIFLLLSASERKIDLERSLALFETFPVKSPVLCDRAVRAALGLGDLTIAVEIHLVAATVNPGSVAIGTPAILNYATRHENWRLAIEVWYRLWQNRMLYFSTRRDLWREVDAMPLHELLFKTEKAADFAIDAAERSNLAAETGPSSDAVTAAREFALSMAERAFEVRGTAVSQDQYVRLLEKLVEFGDATKIRIQALQQLLSLRPSDQASRLAPGQKGLLMVAIQIYEQLRHDSDFVPSQILLEGLFTFLRISKSASGILMMLEDWKKFIPTKISIEYYIQMAKIAAGRGQVAAAERVFQTFLSDYDFEKLPDLVRSKMVNFRLCVHMRRVDTVSVVEQFENVQKKYGFTPDTVSYNMVMMTFARAGDVDGAMGWFRSLQDQGLVPSPRTFSTLMLMYARRGDLDAVQDLWREKERMNMKTSRSMIDAFVIANVHEERFQEAEALAEKAIDMNLEGTGIHMWNVLLNAYSLRGDLENVSRLHNRMHELKVGENGDTYNALLLSLCMTGNYTSAMRIFKHLMPKLGIPYSRRHCVTLMQGALREHRPTSVFNVYRVMLREKLIPDPGIHSVLLRGAVAMHGRDGQRAGVEDSDLQRAREVLDMTLKSCDPAVLASEPSGPYRKADPPIETMLTSNYGFMIHTYGLKASFQKVAELYDEYIAAAKGANQAALVDSPPTLMLSALLTAHVAAGNDDEIERCWTLALEKCAKFAQRSNANLSEPGWVLPYRRFVINPILRKYMRHLNSRNRLDDMITTIKSLRRSGYDLHGPNWNTYVSYLARSDSPQHCLLAFEICENELMQAWPGWERLARGRPLSSAAAPWHLKKTFRRENHGAASKGYKRTPRYETLVQLAGVYVEGRGERGGASRGGVAREDLWERAPVTVGAVTTLPRIEDNFQAEF